MIVCLIFSSIDYSHSSELLVLWMERKKSKRRGGWKIISWIGKQVFVREGCWACWFCEVDEWNGIDFWLQVSTLNSRLKSINFHRTSFNHTARSISAARSNKISNECSKMKRDERLKFSWNLFGFSISFSPGPGSRLSHQKHGIVCVACELRFIVMFEACGGDFGNILS